MADLSTSKKTLKDMVSRNNHYYTKILVLCNRSVLKAQHAPVFFPLYARISNIVKLL